MSSPIEWYECFGKALKNVKAKIGDRDVAFETGLDETISLIKTVKKKGRAVWWVGNGGSAAICSHLAQDMMNKLGIKSMYHGDSSLMTCMANDFGYENVYAKPLKLLSEKEDLLMAISSSGNSRNILNSLDVAQEKGLSVITLSGFHTDNQLWNRPSDASFFVSSDLYGIVEMTHEALLHGLIESMWLEERQ